MVAGMMYVHILLCTSMAVVVLRDFAAPLWLALTSRGAQPKASASGGLFAVLAAALRGGRPGDREAARGRHLAELARSLEAIRAGDDRQGAAAALRAFGEASALAALLGRDGGDHEARRALFGAVEAALQALDLRDEGALAAADGLLADLRRLGALSAWQLDRLCDTLEVQLELDDALWEEVLSGDAANDVLRHGGSAARASYEQLPPVRAERAGDHRLADLLDAEYSAMHAEEQLLGTAC
ncbi:unnamed protein product [Prorocentrum cordatum]|uniref:Uncharacterized protein n=1 Tax=Prorocentrum cordatum TaxID=2364126 RepID=A0ABN9SXX5_9DINO|nr:unnamed protein product [Polarella glacialis]